MWDLKPLPNLESSLKLSLKLLNPRVGTQALATTIGSSFALSEKTRIYSEREYSSYQSEDGFADILGFQSQLNENWDFEAKYERRHLDEATERVFDVDRNNAADRSILTSSNVLSGALAYTDGDKLRLRLSLEGRRDQGEPKLLQWVTRNSLEYQINEDLVDTGTDHFGALVGNNSSVGAAVIILPGRQIPANSGIQAGTIFGKK